MEIIAIVNQKGGVGKTSTAHAVGAGLLRRGKKVLFVDMDPQGNLSYTFNVSPTVTVYELITRRASAQEAICRTPGGDIIPSHPLLAGADMEVTQTGKEYRLKEALIGLSQAGINYDYIIIDTPPALGILTVNALTAAHSLIIPAQADIYSLQGIGQLYGTIQAVRQYCNPGLKIRGILLTRFSSRSILSRDIAELIAETAQKLETRVFESSIRENIAVKEAQASRRDLFEYAPKSNAAADYEMLVDELDI